MVYYTIVRHCATVLTFTSKWTVRYGIPTTAALISTFKLHSICCFVRNPRPSKPVYTKTILTT